LTTNVTIKSIGSNLNLSNTTIGSGVTTLEATRFGSDFFGVQITDGLDNTGRTLVGTAARDILSGRGGNDIFIPGDGADTIIGGAGDDRIQINAETNLSARTNISGGDGRDSLVVTSTSIATLITENDFEFTTLEVIDLRGGSPNGVTFSVRDAFRIDNVGVGVEIIGDGTNDKVVFRDSAFQVEDQFTFNGINQIEMSNAERQFVLFIGSETGVINVTSFTISGVLHSQITEQGPHRVVLRESDFNSQSTPSFDFSNTTLSGVQLAANSSNLPSTIGFNKNTNFGTFEILGNFGGEDVLEYKSTLVSGNGTTINVSDDLAITRISSQGFRNDHIRTDTNGVIDFTFSSLPIDASQSTETAILSNVETLLESRDPSTNLTGLSSSGGAVLAADANAEILLILHSLTDSVMVLYQEGTTAEEDYSNELSLIGVFDSDTISDSSII